MIDLDKYFKSHAKLIEDWMNEHLINKSAISEGLEKSMRYSVFAGGKRIRPALMYASYSVFADDQDKVTPFAAAIEMLHTYSLIHDDLPAMDNDDLRRGKPTNHKMFGEATAILAGDALLTKAFEIMADRALTKGVCDKVRVSLISGLANAAGDNGMVAGQYADMEFENKAANLEEIEFIHKNKTAALLSYSASAGAIITEQDEKHVANLSEFGKKIGIVFQIVDDILDVTSTTEELGKPVNSDAKNNKSTYPALFGVEKSYKIANDLTLEATERLNEYGSKADILKAIAHLVCERKS